MTELSDSDNGHVLQPRFGFDRIDQPNPVEVLAEELPMGFKDGIAVDVLLREAYDQLYGIFNHENPSEQRPLALVALHEKERYNPHTKLYQMMERFVKFKVKERSGLNWNEFIQQPRDMVERWFDICVREQEREVSSPDARRMEREIGQLERNLQQR